jgi:hypothetical protein
MHNNFSKINYLRQFILNSYLQVFLIFFEEYQNVVKKFQNLAWCDNIMIQA